MIKEHKVSLWLGNFTNAEEFNAFVNVSYDEDGNQVPSQFQKLYGIDKYDMDAIETDWIEIGVKDVEELLMGFSADSEIIPQYKELLKAIDIQKYNSIILLYKYEYEGEKRHYDNVDFIGTVDAFSDGI